MGQFFREPRVLGRNLTWGFYFLNGGRIFSGTGLKHCLRYAYGKGCQLWNLPQKSFERFQVEEMNRLNRKIFLGSSTLSNWILEKCARHCSPLRFICERRNNANGAALPRNFHNFFFHFYPP